MALDESRRNMLQMILLDELCDDSIAEQTMLMITAAIPQTSSLALRALMLHDDNGGAVNGTPTRVRDYYVSIIPSYSASEFRSHFRMTRSTVEV